MSLPGAIRPQLPALTAPAPAPCKICGGTAPIYGAVDFNRSCEEQRGVFLPRAGVPIVYNRCLKCGFLFSRSFDGWTHDDYRSAIYNDGYAAVDPDYAERRPANSAGILERLFGDSRASLSVLDYGGGNGLLAELLVARGFAAVRTYDPFTPAYAELPAARFDLVCCFETLEHVPDPLATIGQIAGLVDVGGMVLFSTLLQPGDFEQKGLGWWYVGPRNGHISIFSQPALVTAWARHGLRLASYNPSLHVAFREIPRFARHMFAAKSV